MAAIAGVWATSADPGADHLLSPMIDIMAHRGCYPSKNWFDSEACLALACRPNFSTQENITANSKQLVSNRYVIIFDGNIHNYKQIQNNLLQAGHTLRSNSQNEALLTAIQTWGLKETLKQTAGPFALALWDRQEKTLHLARDRMGQKPLYWGWQDNTFLFGSELKAFFACPIFKPHVNRGALALLLRQGYISAPWSILNNVYKLLPGHTLTLPLNRNPSYVKTITPTPYWLFNDIVSQGLANPFTGSDEEAIKTAETCLLETIEEQMQSSVPVGALFSAGIDSTLIAALMQKISTKPVPTYTIDSLNSDCDEAIHAQKIATLLGTQHTLLTSTPEDALTVIEQLPTIYCEPLSAHSQVPLYLLGQKASSDVGVLFSGDGGDELFGGYNRYLNARLTWLHLQRLPKPLRYAIATLLNSVSPANWNNIFNKINPLLPPRYRMVIPGTKAQKLADVLKTDTEQDYFYRLTSHWLKPESVVKNAAIPLTLLTEHANQPHTNCFEHWMMAMDAQTFLQEEGMTKVDRAISAAGLDARTPLVNHRIMELAWRMPLRMKIRDNQGKWILRQILYRHVPRQLMDRPKHGFGFPIGEWLRGPLKPWADSLLSEDCLESGGYFNPEPILQIWQEHLSGKNDWQYRLWPILSFQAWSKKWL